MPLESILILSGKYIYLIINLVFRDKKNKIYLDITETEITPYEA